MPSPLEDLPSYLGWKVPRSWSRAGRHHSVALPPGQGDGNSVNEALLSAVEGAKERVFCVGDE